MVEGAVEVSLGNCKELRSVLRWRCGSGLVCLKERSVTYGWIGRRIDDSI